ncbi:type IV secretory system conjugative DNA transfer family protein, partial [Candidatus Microgenomates bacterium]|nr:type IV secretory system conjugative DNA transfer family protein [Candidatus Microgenomates bacterium]
TILALLDYPHATMLGITRMLTEKDFRQRIIKQIQDPVVKNFWVNEFASWNEKFASEAVAPVLNKVGAFTANPLIRNLVGQPRSAMDLRQIMDEGKILVVNLSRGRVGEDNASTLGALMVTKIQLAAMSRANIEGLEQRRPFYLYVDEFQNFATSSFAVILSEARKYGLYLTIANQYVAQMAEEVRDAVFGNVGTMIIFRIGADDAQYIAKYVEPTFEGQDLINLHNMHFVISMSIDGEKVPPFSARSLLRPEAEADYSGRIIELSRQRYASPRQMVEQKIARWANFEKLEQKPNKVAAASRRHSTPDITGVKTTDNELRPDQPVKLR